MFVGRCQKENAADLREVLVKFLWKMTYIIILYASSSSSPSSLKRDSQVRDCTPTRVKELPGWVADDVIFPIRVVGPSEMGLLPGASSIQPRHGDCHDHGESWRRCGCPSRRE